MRKVFMLFALGLLCIVARAIPADPTPMQVTQPDGTKLTLVLHGDEFFHFVTTSDGYTVLKNEAGYYTYARLDGDRLVAGDRIARDLSQRTASDLAALASVPKGLTDRIQASTGTQMLGRRNSAMRRVGADGLMDYENFRGLIILINYRDKKFSMPEPGVFYDDMVNTHDYTGYTLNNRRINMTGSVRDYYYDNSNHIFDPHFDVVGPVDVPYSCTYPQSTSRSDAIFHAALDSIDDQVDFSQYDTDGDGYVDMVFFLVAGFSANYGGNNENYLWPHMYYLFNAPERDGVLFGLYACSTEIAGWEGYYYSVNGIGTFCHEFGHVLGLPDLYDTDYEGSGGESRSPGDWSIMAGGSGDDFGRNPVGYSLYERYSLGFTTPQLLDSAGVYELQSLDLCNLGYRLNTPNQDEFFLIENRQPGKWDKFLPGHGMMVARVDSSNVRVWWQNTVNCDPKHMYYELLRAKYTGRDSDSDPFPGKGGVTSITNFTDPSVKTWDQAYNDFIFKDITENGQLISFSLQRFDPIIVTEDFEAVQILEEEYAKDIPGAYCNWDFSKCSVVEPGEGKCNGLRAVAMKKPSMIATSSPLTVKPYAIHYTVFNPTSTEAGFRLTYSFDKGETWEEPVVGGTFKVSAKSVKSTTIPIPTTAPVMMRLNQTIGNARVACYLDDFQLYYDEYWEPEPILGDVNGDGEVNIADVNAVIDVILTGENNLAGDVNGDGEVNIADVNMIIDMIIN